MTPVNNPLINNPLSFIGLGGKKKTVAPAPKATEQETLQDATELPLEEPQPAPLFSVTKGEPSEEELVALTMAVVALQEGQKKDQSSYMAAWQRVLDRGQKLGVRLRPGPGSWKRAQPM